MPLTQEVHAAGLAWMKEHNPYSDRTVEHGDWNRGFQFRIAGLALGKVSKQCGEGYDAAGSFLITSR